MKSPGIFRIAGRLKNPQADGNKPDSRDFNRRPFRKTTAETREKKHHGRQARILGPE